MSPVSYVEVIERCVCSGGGAAAQVALWNPLRQMTQQAQAEALTHVDGAWEWVSESGPGLYSKCCWGRLAESCRLLSFN